MTYRFVTNGDNVDFLVDANLIISPHKNSRVITWNYDGIPGITFTVNGVIYSTDDVGDISFNDVALTTQAGFISGIQAMFPGYAGGIGRFGVPFEDETSAIDRVFNLNDKSIIIRQGVNSFLAINPEVNNESSQLRAYNVTGGDNEAKVLSFTSNTEARTIVYASFNGEAKVAAITIVANASIATIQAVGLLEFANNGAAVSGGLEVDMLYTTAGAIKIVTA